MVQAAPGISIVVWSQRLRSFQISQYLVQPFAGKKTCLGQCVLLRASPWSRADWNLAVCARLVSTRFGDASHADAARGGHDDLALHSPCAAKRNGLVLRELPPGNSVRYGAQ